ncbi:MAG TPA: SDR family NAD(P)-dependent oxidoreductase [Usitatibacter sp.]|jgi:NAD(P)-dependent dehydrogenase (short-subunit alcohol dehydrogenase family)|nr:SDR family NAD(P)-dependent oxidoreductase [Usitatibacter sp.]
MGTPTATAPRASALVVGVGAARGLGAALCRRFAAEGLHVFACGRTAAKVEAVAQAVAASGGRADPVVGDATREEDVAAVFERVERAAPLEIVVYNAGLNRKADFRTLPAAEFEEAWRIGCFGGFLVGREAARRLVPRGRGTVLFTGASASLRGRPGFAQFAAAKAGLRMVAQAMAREYGPTGVHVAHMLIDGGIDGERLRERFPDVAAQRGDDGLLALDALAEAYWQVHRQPRSAWSHEVELRPFKEPF